MSESNSLTELRSLMRAAYEACPDTSKQDVIDHVRRAADAEQRTAGLNYGLERVYGDVERSKDPATTLRRGSLTRDAEGEQLSLPLLRMTFRQASMSNDRKVRHARGAVSEAEFERRVIALGEERCRERGLEPYEIDLVIGTFIDDDEVLALRRQWAA